MERGVRDRSPRGSPRRRRSPLTFTFTLTVVIVVVVTLHSAALTAAEREPDADELASPAPSFVMNARYGRSPPAHAHERHIHTRVDRSSFLMVSRYGKRSHWVTAVEGGGEGGRGREGRGRGVEPPLYCEYTGVMALYRCFRIPNDRGEEHHQ